jgi:hypothetical protein
MSEGVMPNHCLAGRFDLLTCSWRASRSKGPGPISGANSCWSRSKVGREGQGKPPNLPDQVRDVLPLEARIPGSPDVGPASASVSHPPTNPWPPASSAPTPSATWLWPTTSPDPVVNAMAPPLSRPGPQDGHQEPKAAAAAATGVPAAPQALAQAAPAPLGFGAVPAFPVLQSRLEG